MHLLAPWWWLLLPPLAGALILLYLLKLRRRDYPVPSVFLWEQALQDLQANAPLQKLRRNLLLLLQLLALLLIIAALSRPAMQWLRSGGQNVVLVLDTSASMKSTDVAPSRFAQAVSEGHRVIEALGAHDRMMLLAVGSTTRALTPFITDKRALHAALDRLQPDDGRADLRGALDMVAGLVSSKREARKTAIEIISDGALPAVSLPPGLPADQSLHFVKIGKRGENVGIVMLDVRWRANRQRGFEGLVALQSFCTRPRRFTMEISINGRLLDAREINLPARGQCTEVLSALPTTGGLLSVKLDVQDDLAVDNTAQLILPNADPVAVVLATTGNVFLHTALALDPTVHVTESTTVPPDLAPGTVLIADNVPVARLPRGVSALLIGAAGAAVPGRLTRVATNPTIADWDRRHPALTGVTFTDLHLAQSAILAPAPNARAIIESDAGPIALAREVSGQRIIYLGWDLHRSDFPLRVGFPIFVANALDWLSGNRQRAAAVNIRTGQSVEMPLPADVTQVTLRAPGGHTQPLTLTGARAVVEHVPDAGVYQVTGKGVDLRFAANLLDARESDIAPRDQLALEAQNRPVTAAHGRVRTDRDLWRALLLLALLVLCAEWWVFHRRVG